MSHETDRTRYILPKLSEGNYTTLMRMLYNLRNFDISDAAKFRLHVLDHYYKHGWKSTVHAFGVGKSTLYDWRKTFEDSRKRLSSLVPKSTRPINTRVMTTDYRIVEFIRSMREAHGNVSKYKLKSFVDEYTKKLNIPTISVSVIGKVIKRKHLFFEGRLKVKRKLKRPFYPRIKRAPKENIPGYIEMDSITLWVLGKKYTFITAIDVVSKFAWCKIVAGLSSRCAREAFKEFRQNYPHKIREVQTDNGSEFLGEFDQYLTGEKIPHQFIYPRSPKVNGVVERFNRTTQVEFIERNDEILYDPEKFEQKLKSYLFWYNTQRPHQALKYLTPTKYLETFTAIPKST